MVIIQFTEREMIKGSRRRKRKRRKGEKEKKEKKGDIKGERGGGEED